MRLILGAVFLYLAGVAMPAGAAEKTVVHMFISQGCPHCHEAEEFLVNVTAERDDVETRYYDIAEQKNMRLFGQVADKYGVQKGTPMILINNVLMVGYDRSATTGQLWRQIFDVERKINRDFEEVLDGGAVVVSSLASDICAETDLCSEGENAELIRTKAAPEDRQEGLRVAVPIIGNIIDVGSLSLVSLSLVLGLIDGFNPCAMWVLVMFLVLLSQIGDRKKMWQYAGLFILAQAIMYYLILTVWLVVWDFVALNRIVTPLVGLLAVGSGGYFLYKWWTFKPVCDVTSPETQAKVERRARLLVSKPLTLTVALGVIVLALSVNIFEFVCSIGIPQAYTKILDLNNLTWLAKQAYAGLYLFGYMIDDVFVFVLALYSFEKIGLTHKYSKLTALIGGLLMIALGVLMLFKPEWLIV